MPARSCIVTLLTLAVAAVAELCSIGKIGHVHFAEDPSKSAVLASVCCPETCDRCGGVDCWSQSGGLDCCAKHVYDLGLACTEDEETGCVLPEPTAMVLPAQQRERSCIDMWSAAFPNEREVSCHPNSQPAPAHAAARGRARVRRTGARGRASTRSSGSSAASSTRRASARAATARPRVNRATRAPRRVRRCTPPHRRPMRRHAPRSRRPRPRPPPRPRARNGGPRTAARGCHGRRSRHACGRCRLRRRRLRRRRRHIGSTRRRIRRCIRRWAWAWLPRTGQRRPAPRRRRGPRGLPPWWRSSWGCSWTRRRRCCCSPCCSPSASPSR